MSASSNRPARPPVRWSTHWQHILLVIAVVVGGSLFGFSFVLWPLRPVERIIGAVVLLGVAAVLVWLATYLTRPLPPAPSRRTSRR